MKLTVLVVLACLLTVTLAGKKAKSTKQKTYTVPKMAPKSSYAPHVVYVPVYHSGGPDKARYVYSAPFYDYYKKGDIRLNRFPGGVHYTHNENGYGANVKVNFQSYPSQAYAAGNNKG